MRLHMQDSGRVEPQPARIGFPFRFTSRFLTNLLAVKFFAILRRFQQIPFRDAGPVVPSVWHDGAIYVDLRRI